MVTNKKKIAREITIAFLVAMSMASFSGRKVSGHNLIDDDILSQPTRKEIFNVIQNDEGCHFRKICRTLDKKIGVIQYHLNVLEKNGFIRSVKDGRYKCFFISKRDPSIAYQPEDSLTNDQKRLRENIITSTKRTTPKKIIKYLIENDNTASHQTLAKISEVTPQAITFHCQKLQKDHLINSKKVGREKFYSIEESVLNLLDYVDI